MEELNTGDTVQITHPTPGFEKYIGKTFMITSSTKAYDTGEEIYFGIETEYGNSGWFKSELTKITTKIETEENFETGDMVELLGTKSTGCSWYTYQNKTNTKKGTIFPIKRMTEVLITINDIEDFYFTKKDLKLIKKQNKTPICTICKKEITNEEPRWTKYQLQQHEKCYKQKREQEENKQIINQPKQNKLMESITKFAKNLTLSIDQKALRQVGIKDENGNYTREAREIVTNLKAEALGFKNTQKMIESTGSNQDIASIIEYAEMFLEYEDKLIEIAHKAIKENKK
jgi:hypothetical protein